MRGSPPIQLFLLLLAFGLVGAVLLRLTTTQAPNAPQSQKVTQTVQATPSTIHVEWAGKLEKLEISHEGHDLAPGADLAAESAEFKVKLHSLQSGIELKIHAVWPTGTPKTALSIDVVPDGQEARSSLRWTDTGELDDILVFTW